MRHHDDRTAGGGREERDALATGDANPRGGCRVHPGGGDWPEPGHGGAGRPRAAQSRCACDRPGTGVQPGLPAARWPRRRPDGHDLLRHLCQPARPGRRVRRGRISTDVDQPAARWRSTRSEHAAGVGKLLRRARRAPAPGARHHRRGRRDGCRDAGRRAQPRLLVVGIQAGSRGPRPRHHRRWPRLRDHGRDARIVQRPQRGQCRPVRAILRGIAPHAGVGSRSVSQPRRGGRPVGAGPEPRGRRYPGGHHRRPGRLAGCHCGIGDHRQRAPRGVVAHGPGAAGAGDGPGERGHPPGGAGRPDAVCPHRARRPRCCSRRPTW